MSRVRPTVPRPAGRPGGRGLLLALVAVSALLVGCGAGQQAQTATEQPTNDETTANVGSLALRDIAIATPESGRYARGDDARLEMVVVNDDLVTSDELVAVRTPAAERVVVAPAPRGTVPGAGRPSAVAAPSGIGPTPRPAADTAAKVEIPPDTAVSFRGSRPAVTLLGLTQQMSPGQVVQVTFVFAKAGAVSVPVAVAVPVNPVPPAPTAQPSTIPGAGPA